MVDILLIINLLLLFSVSTKQSQLKHQREYSGGLACYEYMLEARPINKHGNADAMSRFPLKVKPQETPQPPEFVLLLDTMSEAPITCSQIQTWTRQDSVLASVLSLGSATLS